MSKGTKQEMTWESTAKQALATAKKVAAERDRLKAVNAELVKACEFIANTDKPGMSSDERYEMIVMAQQAAKAAIAKATS